MHNHKIAYDNARLEIAKQTLALRREESARRPAKASLPSLKQQNSANPLDPENPVEDLPRESDHLGPLARNWEDVRARAQKAFGITPEESARRAELRRTWKPPETTEPLPASPADETIPVQQLAQHAMLVAADAKVATVDASGPSSARAAQTNRLPHNPNRKPGLDAAADTRTSRPLNVIELLRAISDPPAPTLAVPVSSLASISHDAFDNSTATTADLNLRPNPDQKGVDP